MLDACEPWWALFPSSAGIGALMALVMVVVRFTMLKESKLFTEEHTIEDLTNTPKQLSTRSKLGKSFRRCVSC
jgi:hypothetical protein